MKEELKTFVSALQSVLLEGSNMVFENMVFDEDKINFNLMYIGRSKKQLWRRIEIKIDGLVIKQFKSSIPVEPDDEFYNELVVP